MVEDMITALADAVQETPVLAIVYVLQFLAWLAGWLIEPVQLLFAEQFGVTFFGWYGIGIIIQVVLLFIFAGASMLWRAINN